MNWLVLLFALELGYAPIYGSLNVLPESAEHNVTENIGYILFEAEVIAWNTLFIGGATKTYIQSKQDTITRYRPFESDYLFNAGLRFSQLEIGYRHLCLHPTRPYEIIYQPQQSTDAWYDEFYIRIEIKRE